MRAIRTIYARFTATLIIAVFMLPMILQGLHHHLDKHDETSQGYASRATLSKVVHKCEVCDFKFYLFTQEVIIFTEFKIFPSHSTVSASIAELGRRESPKAKKGRAPPCI